MYVADRFRYIENSSDSLISKLKSSSGLSSYPLSTTLSSLNTVKRDLYFFLSSLETLS